MIPQHVCPDIAVPAASTPGHRHLKAFAAENWHFVSLVCGYMLVGAVLLAALGRPWRPVWYRQGFLLLWGALSVLWLAWQYLRHPRRLRQALAPARLSGAVTVAVLAVPAQSAFQALKQSIGPVVGFRWDSFLNKVDVSLHGGPAWILYSRLWPRDWLPWLYLLYMLWFIALYVFLLWAAWTSRRELRVRALSAFALVWIVGGTLLAGAFSSAGPCFLDNIGLDNAQYSGLLQLLDVTGTGVRSNQTALWSLLATGTPATFGGVSAFPSMHVAIAVLWALVAWHRHRVLGTLMMIYAAIIQVGSVMLAWHYAVDGYAGTAVAFACWTVAGRFQLNRPDNSGGTGGANRPPETDDSTPPLTAFASPDVAER